MLFPSLSCLRQGIFVKMVGGAIVYQNTNLSFLLRVHVFEFWRKAIFLEFITLQLILNWTRVVKMGKRKLAQIIRHIRDETGITTELKTKWPSIVKSLNTSHCLVHSWPLFYVPLFHAPLFCVPSSHGHYL